MASFIIGKFIGTSHKHLKTREGESFTKVCFKIEVANEKSPRPSFPFFEAKESIVPYLGRLKRGDEVKISFVPDSKGVEGNEISINRAFRVELVEACQ